MVLLATARNSLNAKTRLSELQLGSQMNAVHAKPILHKELRKLRELEGANALGQGMEEIHGETFFEALAFRAVIAAEDKESFVGRDGVDWYPDSLT